MSKASRAKEAEERQRKLLELVSTPEAKAQRAITEAEHDSRMAFGWVIPTPEPYLLTEAQEVESTMTLDEACVACGLSRVDALGRFVPIWSGLGKRLVVAKTA